MWPVEANGDVTKLKRNPVSSCEGEEEDAQIDVSLKKIS